MELTGWGRFPRIETELIEPVDAQAITSLLKNSPAQGKLIARGAGRSYGDSSLAEQMVCARYLDNFISFDENQGLISCGSGISLGQLLDISVPKGWLLPVVPGTRFVTVGGAIASDVHGKNHHRDGCFSNFVKSVTLLLASGETISCSARNNARLFRATCGGMGLTGVILDATLQLEKITSAWIDQQTRPAANLEEIFTLFDIHADSKYSVAWLDCLASGPRRGRSILFTGEPAATGGLEIRKRRTVSAPPFSPALFINRYTIGAFNRLYYTLHSRRGKQRRLSGADYFFPLDRIRNWNRLYGRKGFVQYQLVVPLDGAREAIDAILARVASAGKGSFLAVLKKMGPANRNLLSFPLEGYTLALDFKLEKDLFPLLDNLDDIVAEHGGRLYLSKDARMSRELFRKTYPRWEEFSEIRAEFDPVNRFGSLQSRRLGLSA